MDAVPADLHSDAEEYESDDTQDAMGGGGRDACGDFRCVRVREEDQDAKSDDGNEDGGVGEDVFAQAFHRGMGTQGEHDHDASGIDGDGEGKWIKDSFADCAIVGVGDDIDCGAGLRILFVKQSPPHGSEDKSTGDLDHGQGNSEKSEQSRADKFDDEKEDNGADGDGAGEIAIDGSGDRADEAEKDEGGAEGIDHGKKGAEGEREEFEHRGHAAEQHSIS